MISVYSVYNMTNVCYNFIKCPWAYDTHLPVHKWLLASYSDWLQLSTSSLLLDSCQLETQSKLMSQSICKHSSGFINNYGKWSKYWWATTQSKMSKHLGSSLITCTFNTNIQILINLLNILFTLSMNICTFIVFLLHTVLILYVMFLYWIQSVVSINVFVTTVLIKY